MRKLWWILIIIGIVIAAIVAGGLFWSMTLCSVGHMERCDRSCETDSECRQAYCSCINADEEVSSWEDVNVMCMPTNCRCVDNQCTNIGVNHHCGLDHHSDPDVCCQVQMLCNSDEIGSWNEETEDCECVVE